MSREVAPLYEATPEAAAKIIAEHVGAKGKAGGWIYDRHDRPMFHGWNAYAKALTASGIIRAKLVTEHRKSRKNHGQKVTRYAINWRRLRRPM
jgi:hypothetical protein